MSARPYGISIIMPLNDSVLALCQQLGIPVEHQQLLSKASMPVCFISSSSILSLDEVGEFARRGGVCIVGHPKAFTFFSCQRIVTSWIATYTASVPLAYGVARMGSGIILAIDENILRLLYGYDRQWHAIGFEERSMAVVPCTSIQKFSIVNFWADILRVAFSHCCLPLIHRWFFPDMAQVHCTLRVDADWYDQREWETTVRLSRPLGRHVSWYVTCRDIDYCPHKLQLLREAGYEIGSHGYYHYTFYDEPNNLANMQRAHACLQTMGVPVSSFVSPSAKWSPGLQRVIERLGYSLSSEFSYAHDTYPILPFIDGQYSSALQIPVHPVSPINFLKFTKTAKEDMWRYYHTLIHQLSLRCLPVHLYGHPADLIFLEGSGIIEAMASLSDASISTLADYASWWKVRSATPAISYEQAHGKTIVHCSAPSSSVSHAISYQADKIFLTRASTIICSYPNIMMEYAKTVHVQASPLPFVVKTLKKNQNLRSAIGLWLDYENIVPSSEYNVSSPRTALNKVVKWVRGL